MTILCLLTGVQMLAAQLQERATGTGAVRMKALQESPVLVEHFSVDLMPHLLPVYNGSMSQQVVPCPPAASWLLALLVMYCSVLARAPCYCQARLCCRMCASEAC